MFLLHFFPHMPCTCHTALCLKFTGVKFTALHMSPQLNSTENYGRRCLTQSSKSASSLYTIINMSNGAVFKIYWSKIRNSTETNVLQTSSSNKYEFHSHKKTTTKINHVHDYTVDWRTAASCSVNFNHRLIRCHCNKNSAVASATRAGPTHRTPMGDASTQESWLVSLKILY